MNGESALTLTKKTGNGEKFVLHVATEGEPYLLKGGENPGETTLTDYGKKVDAEEPTADEVVAPRPDPGLTGARGATGLAGAGAAPAPGLSGGPAGGCGPRRTPGRSGR
ncbi:hypothetical protein ACFWDF_34045, partial [Streptomyces diastaticus]